jgi:hypothetical protein
MRAGLAPVQLLDCERYFRLAIAQENRAAQMQFGVFLISGVLGRFYCEEARTLRERVSQSNRFATILLDRYRPSIVN